MKGQDAERLAGVLALCPALARLDLSGNYNFGAGGAERLAGVLGQCRELVHLNLSGNCIGDPGAELQECWRSAQCWHTSISATCYTQAILRGLQECCRSAERGLLLGRAEPLSGAAGSSLVWRHWSKNHVKKEIFDFSDGDYLIISRGSNWWTLLRYLC
jgi:hypothetical protein